ncbi:MAG: protein translocase subunit SecF [Hyphomonadaceae bacterium]|nr:protein translocase subunit SecF [Hyphomonadaceae bacterium]
MWPLIKFLPEKTNFKYVALAPFLGGLAVLACIASLYLTLVPFKAPCAGLNCGVDFQGGTLIELSSPGKTVDLGRLRSVLADQGVGDVQVQAFGNRDAAMVKFETPEGENAAAIAERVKTAITATLGDVTYDRTEVVGPQVSNELLLKGVMALLLGIGLMLIYIWFRFGLTFGLGAVIALAHDVVLTFGLFAFTKMEFTLVAVGSILTIIGYSINDKIVVLDRIRENLRKYKKMPMGDLIDLSVNETLSRTIITGVTGLMALCVMAFFGGEALFAFSVSMAFGIVVGTFSSIFVSAPILLVLGIGRSDAAAPRSDGDRAAQLP